MVNSDRKSYISKNNRFDRKTLEIIHMLHPYVKQRIKIVEGMGILPRNMYQPNEIIDEVVLDIYESDVHHKIELEDLRLLMFEKLNKNIESLIENEKWHEKSISTKAVLEEELKLLDENFTIDGGNDFIMIEELDDISYHQNDQNPYSLTSEEIFENVMTFLGVQKSQKKEFDNSKSVLQKMYDKLPLHTSNVIDLYLFGKLNLQEISTVLNRDIVELKRIVQFVKENFRKGLI